MQSLVRVTPGYTCVLQADVDELWKIVKVWNPSQWINKLGDTHLSFQLLAGESGEQIGAERATLIDDAIVVEKLVAMDAEEHTQLFRQLH